MVNGELAEWYNSVMIRLIIILRVTVAASAQEKASRDLELVSTTAIENWTTTLHFDGKARRCGRMASEGATPSAE